MPRFIYVMDPMCSWCWAFNPAIESLKTSYSQYEWDYLMGGLAPDSDQPMPADMQQKLQAIWKHIEQQTGTIFNHDFWSKNKPRRSTYPACRAVITAESLAPGSSAEMINGIQKAYYQDARNPSNEDVLIKLAEQIKLDPVVFEQRFNESETQIELDTQINQAHALGAQGFPSLFVENNGEITALSYGYCTTEVLKKRIEAVLAGK